MNGRMKLVRLKPILSLPIDSLAALIGSMICLSLTPIFIRLSEQEIGPNATIFNRFWIAAVAFGLLSALLSVRHRKQDTQSAEQKPHPFSGARLLIVDGVLLSMGLIFWAWSLTQTSVANSSTIHNLVPIFTILGGWLALGQTFDRRFLLGMVVAVVGSVLLEADKLLSLRIDQQLLGDFAALLSAVFFGIHPLIIQQLRTKLNSISIMTGSSIASALLLLPIAILAEDQLFPSSVTGWFTVIALALFGQILGIGLWTYCLKKLSAGFASLLALLIPSLSAIEGWVIFSENLNFLTMVSIIVILLGMYLAISSKSTLKTGVESSN
ncbi:MAG: DMT family transporter [Cyanobacteriota bacterium]|nr:DMT family transporter [Cyanobacteriota bacterium]